MGFMPCKHCHKRINTEVQHAGCEKYGYCSWHCFEAEDPEGCEQVRKARAAGDKALIAIVIAVAAAIFFAVKWLLKKRKEDPPLFKKTMMWGGSACAGFLVLGQFAGCNNVSDQVAETAEHQCQAVRNEFHEYRNMGKDWLARVELSGGGGKLREAMTDIAALEKAGVKCPDGGTYSLKDQDGLGKYLVCSKHKKY